MRSFASALNGLDQVVGDTSGDGWTDATLWDPGIGPVALGQLPGGIRNASARDINDSTWIVGYSQTTAGTRPFLWTPESGMVNFRDLLAGDIRPSTANAINNRGQIVGFAGAPGGSGAYRWDPVEGIMLIVPGGAGHDINDAGEVIGTELMTLRSFGTPDGARGRLTTCSIPAGRVVTCTWYSGLVPAAKSWAYHPILFWPTGSY
jgi:probable HAF family extracellular repeat protein